MLQFLFLASAFLPTHAAAADIVGRVVAISDGDTLTVLDTANKQHRIRLVDIDAPEKRQPFGERSRQALAQICFQRPSQVIPKEVDRYGRIVGTVYCSGADASAEQVRAGMAWVFVKYAPANSPLILLEQEARRSKMGLWRDPHPTPPWDFRATRKAGIDRR
jgi:endonuclease YncB( thermonuclease family)